MPEEGNVNLFAVIGAKQLQIELLSDRVRALEEEVGSLRSQIEMWHAEQPKPEPTPEPAT